MIKKPPTYGEGGFNTNYNNKYKNKEMGIRMKTPFEKEDIKKYSTRTYQCMEECIIDMGGDVDENVNDELNTDLLENTVYCGNCFDSFFEQINVCRFGDRLFVELQKLGDYDGFYKDWAMQKYMQTMHDICDCMDDVWVSNHEYVDDDPAFRAFFIALLFDINEFKYYEEVFKYCHEFCDQLDNLVQRKLCGCYWDKKFEIDEMAFCKMYLTPFFKKIGLEQVIFNHGNKEFGKDYILMTKNIFGKTEYYGAQAKAGNVSGTATSNINEITSQINMGFNVPYKLTNGEDIFISKMIIAISGVYTDNAQTIIQSSVDRYKFTNTLFFSKKELENHKVMTEN